MHILLFDFAEKVLLPRLLKHPGQLYFVSGLKFDIFGVSASNNGQQYIYGLPEGHWSNEKTANAVISMLEDSIDRVRQQYSDIPYALKLHADNCAGQNKNRYLLWYLALRIIT
eukprot:IDg19092t1